MVSPSMTRFARDSVPMARGYVDDALRAQGGSLRSGVENPMDGPSGRFAPCRV